MGYLRSSLLFISFYFIFSMLLIGCSQANEFIAIRTNSAFISEAELKGKSKIDIVKEFGQPLAVSKSEVSECWYYPAPKEKWIWFEEDKVEHWEIK